MGSAKELIEKGIIHSPKRIKKPLADFYNTIRRGEGKYWNPKKGRERIVKKLRGRVKI